MTREEIQQKSQEKVKAVQTLAKQLQLDITAEQVVTKKGLIKLVVYYMDTEKYDIEQPVTTQKNEQDEPKPLESEPSENSEAATPRE